MSVLNLKIGEEKVLLKALMNVNVKKTFKTKEETNQFLNIRGKVEYLN